jgi:geranyl-CoA carboxylase alpha subunit
MMPNITSEPTTINTLLVANRGEIACRIMRSASNLGISTVAVYSDADSNAPHVHQADHAVHIGGSHPAESYLDIDKICQAAIDTGADAVHPGYGFLSENPALVTQLHKHGIIFVGPSVTAMEQMGNKAAARRLMRQANVPVVPGFEPSKNQSDQADTALIDAANQIGYPIMIKAAAGGGGRGMRLAMDATELTELLPVARAEALNAFSNDELILEKAITSARHVEVQILGDAHGNCIHLGERDCSIQRRHQKVIEESPCPVLSPEIREAMCAAAISAAKAVKYTGAGTVEFLLDTKDHESFYFLEMNTRLQVEHPVTEMVTGLDLVALQLQVASGQVLQLTQEDISFNGHAIEARLCSEDAAADFMPTTGTVQLWQPAQRTGTRFDAGIDTGTTITPWYDSLLCKVVAHGDTREQARRRLGQALSDTVLLGPETNQHFLHSALTHGQFINNRISTGFIADNWPDGFSSPVPHTELQAIAVALFCHRQRADVLRQTGMQLSPSLLGWSNSLPIAFPMHLHTALGDISARICAVAGGSSWQVTLNECIGEDKGVLHLVELTTSDTGKITAVVDNNRTTVSIAFTDPNQNGSEHNEQLILSQEAAVWRFSKRASHGIDDTSHAEHSSGRITAPMPGTVAEILVTPGQQVQRGQALAVVEAMKMQHQITADIDGTVATIHVAAGAQVSTADLLLELSSEQPAK